MATLHRLRPAGRCPQGRPWPHQPRTLLAAIEELSDCVRVLTAALVGDTDALPHEPLHRPPAVDFDSEAAAQAEAEAAAAAEAETIEAATEHWDAPWHDLSVRELRALVRDLPIDRSSLPAPIELLRRSELLEALNQVQDLTW
jgi:hypothetical protein